MVSDGKEITTVHPSPKHNLHCPFCDDWATRDSMVGRKRLGLHITNKHPEEVRFPINKKPPPLLDLD